MEVTEEMIEDMKEMYKEQGEEVTDEKAEKAANNLVGLLTLIVEIGIRESKLKNRLKREPKGFPIDGSYSCAVCKNTINEKTGWYSKYGKTCFHCLKALENKVIPRYILDDNDTHFDMSSLNYIFKIKTVTAKKYMREGKLIPRIILDNEGNPYYYIFLKKENPILIRKYSPAKKSYDRHHKKESKKRSKENRKEWMKDLKKRR